MEEKSKKEESMSKQNKEGLRVLVTALIVVLLGLAAAGGYLIGSSKIITVVNNKKSECIKEVNRAVEEVKEETKSLEETTAEVKEDNNANVTSSVAPKCTGTYYVNNDKTQGEYILKEDGTYQVTGKEEFGVFFVKSNTIVFVEQKHTTGPIDQDPIYYNPKSYLILNDCSKIMLAQGHTSADLTRQ